MQKRYYIAYGSNLNIRQMRMRCPTARIVGTAILSNYELLFKGSKTGAYLTVERRPGSTVPVAVWEVTAEDEKALDRYEGFPTFYYKKELEPVVKSGSEVRRLKAFMYVMHEDRQTAIPSRAYVETCADGYDDFCFDTRFLEEALNKSMEAQNERE